MRIDIEHFMCTELLGPRELKSMLGGWFPAAASLMGIEIYPVSPRAELLCVGGLSEVGRRRKTKVLSFLASLWLKKMAYKTLYNSAFPADLGEYALKSSANN